MDATEAPLVDKFALGVLGKGAIPASETGMDYAGLEVSVRDGPVGWYVQLGGNVTHEQLQLKPPPDVRALKITQLREELERRGLDPKGRKAALQERLLQAPDLRLLVPHKRASIPEGIKVADLTMQMAERLLSLPAPLGQHPTRELPISLHSGRFGPYVTMNIPAAGGSTEGADDEGERLVMCSLPKRLSLWDVDVAAAAELLEGRMKRDNARARKGSKGGSKREPKGKRQTKATTRKAQSARSQQKDAPLPRADAKPPRATAAASIPRTRKRTVAKQPA